MEAGSEAEMLESAQYQCLDCLALFDSAEAWLEHRRSHSRSSTHSNAETMVSIQRGTTSLILLWDVKRIQRCTNRI